jgi:tyrosyl-DNA phosphodiesterase-1
LWFQDFYPSSTASSCSFQRSLKDFFDAVLPKTYSLKKELNIDLDVFDFSSSSVELVFSIPGRFPSTRGLGLGRIRDLRGPKQYLKVLYQCSSIGSYNKKSFDDFLRMVTGNQQAEAQIVFPSIKNVRESVLGCEGAGVFFIKKEKFEAKGFPKEKFCRFEGPSGVEQLRGHLSHSKVMILTGEEEGDDDLVYIGSHNLSAAAWGVLEKKESQIYIKNFEIGVAFVPKEGSAALKKRLIGLMPFKVEPSRYDETDRPFYIDSDLNE